MKTFSDWLDDELQQRNWTRAELARRAGISESALSMIKSGQRQPGTDICEAIARAFGYSPETVYRAAGLLPPAPAHDYTEWHHVIDQLSSEDNDEMLEIARLKIKRRHEAEELAKAAQRKPRPAES